MVRATRYGRFTSPTSTLLTVALFVVTTTFPQAIFADEPTCQCHFKDPQWEGYGTHAACSAIMSNGDKTCNVSFGGTGADTSVVADILKRDPADFARQVTGAMATYLAAAQKAPSAVNDPGLIRTALPMFMRGAYLRKSVATDLRQLDKAVVQFSEKYATKIADVFNRRQDPFVVEEAGAKFFVGRGFVTVTFQNIEMTTVFSWAPLGR